MERINIGEGRWFDRERAEQWEEKTRFDGQNRISVATGSQWDHESLYRSAGGTWIIHRWSQWQGTSPSWEVAADEEAHAWLVDNGHAEDVPREAMAALEL